MFCSCLFQIHWSQVLSREWRCSWSSTDRRCSNYIWVINNSFACKGASHIRGLVVIILHCGSVTIWSVFFLISHNWYPTAGPSLKQRCHHFLESVVTGCTGRSNTATKEIFIPTTSFPLQRLEIFYYLNWWQAINKFSLWYSSLTYIPCPFDSLAN